MPRESPRIERSYLDGSNRTVIVTGKLVLPSSITLDLAAERLYFVDSWMDYIETCNYDGSGRTQILVSDHVSKQVIFTSFPANTRSSPKAGSVLNRRWVSVSCLLGV